MKLFEKFTKEQVRVLRKDTSMFYIGSPEAEAESTFNSKIQLFKVFEDFLEVIPKLQSEKFIITGRKGSGKSAIAEYIYYLAGNEYNYFCDFVKKPDIDIERIAQTAKEIDPIITQELLFEWIILIKIIKQLISNVGISDQKEIKDLKIFLKKNSGFVDIKANQINEIIQNKGWEVNVEYFKRFISSKFGSRYDIKSGKAPFYKLIPHLKDTVRELFINTLNKNNHYLLVFDDLDIGFKTNNKNNIQTILNILRVVKEYNISFFGKECISAKIILLLRDDITRFLLTEDADTAKIFSSYEIPLKWYEYDELRKNENQLIIKKFINKRIAVNFDNNNFNYDEKDPWKSLVSDNDNDYVKSSFRYVIDHTLIRPRDLILFFKPLPDLKFSIPLSKQDINVLLGKYSIEFVNELKNELSAHYEPKDITIIFNTLKLCVQAGYSNIKTEYFKSQLEKYNFKNSSDELLDLLFDLSIIGNKLKGDKAVFKHWEKDDEIFRFNPKNKIIAHFTIRNYFQKR